tara:strand:+ start:1272 stop:1487 length:216 start_codon:yes stop_codon:yes gene_type:complete
MEQKMKVYASPNIEIKLGGGILWEITWQRPNEEMNSRLILLPPKGWSDPILEDVLPTDVIQALLQKYGLQS